MKGNKSELNNKHEKKNSSVKPSHCSSHRLPPQLDFCPRKKNRGASFCVSPFDGAIISWRGWWGGRISLGCCGGEYARLQPQYTSAQSTCERREDPRRRGFTGKRSFGRNDAQRTADLSARPLPAALRTVRTYSSSDRGQHTLLLAAAACSLMFLITAEISDKKISFFFFFLSCCLNSAHAFARIYIPNPDTAESFMRQTKLILKSASRA